MKGHYYALLLACLPLAASAGDEVGHWYVDPYAGGITPDNQWDASSGFLGGLAFGRHLNEDWSAELNLNTARLGTDNHSSHTRLGTFARCAARVESQRRVCSLPDRRHR